MLRHQTFIPKSLTQHPLLLQALFLTIARSDGGVIDPHNVSLRGGVDMGELGSSEGADDLVVVTVELDDGMGVLQCTTEVVVEGGERGGGGGGRGGGLVGEHVEQLLFPGVPA